MSTRINLAVANPAVSAVLDNTGGEVGRLSIRETSGVNPATLRLYDGSGTNGVLIDTIALQAGQSTRDSYLHRDYPYKTGLYLQVVSGTVEIGITVRHSDDWEHEGQPVILVNPDVLALSIAAATPTA